MLIDRPKLDPDLEWMLQSGQADDQAIIVTLVKEFYPTIFRFALSILGVYQEARSAAVESLATALVESHRYSGMEGAHLWLFSIAATVCSKAYKKSPKLQKGMTLSSQNVQSVVDQDAMPQSLYQVNYWSAIDSLPLDQRLPVLLRVVCELPVAEIAVVLSEREKTITSQLQVSYRQIAAKNHILDPSQKISIDSGFEKTLSTSLQSDWPLTSSSATENEQLKAEVQTKVQVLRRKSQSRIRIQEISVIGLVMVVVVVLVGIVNSLQSAQDDILPPSPTSQQTPLLFQGNRTAIPTHLATIDHATSPTPISPVISLQPLDLHSTADEVNQRILINTSTWQSLWADVIFYFYGPRGYIGPPVVYRHQVWIVRDESALIINGPLDGKPESSTLETLSRYAPSNNAGLRNVSFRNPISWWQFTNDDWIISPTMYRLFVFREMILEHQSALQILRASAELPGFVALVVDQLGGDGERIARLWVDVKTGL
ncbi:MAG: RNA polymerase sigma factor, partial [Anaerolineales bacterium]